MAKYVGLKRGSRALGLVLLAEALNLDKCSVSSLEPKQGQLAHRRVPRINQKKCLLMNVTCEITNLTY